MRTVAIFTTFYLPSSGGVERYSANLASALSDAGERVILVTSALGACNEGIKEEEGITVLRLPGRVILGGRFVLPKRNRAFREMISWLDVQPIDYILVNQRFYPLSLIGLKYARQRCIPSIVLDHGSAHLTVSNAFFDVFIQAYEHWMTARGRRYQAAYYAASQKSAEWLTHFDVEAKGILHNSIDSKRFVDMSSRRDFKEEIGLPETSFVIAFTGRLMKMKGVLVACRAVEELVGEGASDMHLLIAGEGPLVSQVEAICSRNIHLLGQLCQQDISALLSQAQVFCLPTASEGFSTSMLEAAAHGCGIIVSDTGGAHELIPSYDFGAVLEEPSVECLKKEILAYYQDRERLASCGKNVQSRVMEKFGWDKTAQKLIDAFELRSRE